MTSSGTYTRAQTHTHKQTNNIFKIEILNSCTNFSYSSKEKWVIYLRPCKHACPQSEADQSGAIYEHTSKAYLFRPFPFDFCCHCCFWDRTSLCRLGRLQTWHPLVSASWGQAPQACTILLTFQGYFWAGKLRVMMANTEGSFSTSGIEHGLHWLPHSIERPNCHFPDALPT